MDSLVGETIVNIKFDNEYYDSDPDDKRPCFGNSSGSVFIQTTGGKCYQFTPVNDETDYQLGMLRNQDEELSTVSFTEWSIFINTPIAIHEIIRNKDTHELIAVRLTFQNQVSLIVMCGDYEFDESLNDFIIFPGSSGILVFFDENCYQKYLPAGYVSEPIL